MGTNPRVPINPEYRPNQCHITLHLNCHLACLPVTILAVQYNPRIACDFELVRLNKCFAERCTPVTTYRPLKTFKVTQGSPPCLILSTALTSYYLCTTLWLYIISHRNHYKCAFSNLSTNKPVRNLQPCLSIRSSTSSVGRPPDILLTLSLN